MQYNMGWQQKLAPVLMLFTPEICKASSKMELQRPVLFAAETPSTWSDFGILARLQSNSDRDLQKQGSTRKKR
jgi:hypothetical protein